MPHLFFASSDEDPRASSQPPEYSLGEKNNMWGKTWNKVGHWLKKEDENEPTAIAEVPAAMYEKDREKEVDHNPTPTRTRPVIPGLPRPLTFARQNSERRDKLCPVTPDPEERRAASVDRRAPGTHFRLTSPPPPLPTFCSTKTHAPESVRPGNDPSSPPHELAYSRIQFDSQNDGQYEDEIDLQPYPGLSHNDLLRDPEHLSDALDDLQIQAELEAKWILNLSMHFRDNSDREKFFITYAEEPSKWRRVTVSCDYRTMPADSLEADLKSLHYQRDKSARIYESIRDSLPDIQFYPTVTNLKLQTSDGRLHVHVTEDVNEIIQYPSVSLLRHIECRHFKESTIEFDSHLSGFVYKVRAGGRVYIKKEIPGPEAVEEFLYEANALSSLRDSPNVVRFEGIVVDDREQIVKGLLLSYAEQGALVDLVYDYKHTEWLPWTRRERWAKQIVAGLADIHESGFVQGDFTLSNIVVDEADSARIIDINRRGCPVGWEPPELARLIQSGQRISSYIGIKSDLFQLGMVLWALAEQQDEPERQEHPLQFTYPREIPEYYHAIVKSCLSENLRDRLSAKDLLKQFPSLNTAELKSERVSSAQLSPHRSEKKYIDPATAVGLEDVDYLKNVDQIRHHIQFSASEATFADGTPSTEYLFVSSGSEMAGTRGRSSARTSLEESLPNRSVSNFRASVDKQIQQAVIETNSTNLLLHASSDAVDTHEEDITSHSVATITPPTPASRQDSEDTIMEVKDYIGRGRSSQDRLPNVGSQDLTLEHITALETTLSSRFGPPAHQDSGFHELPIVDVIPIREEQTFPSAGLNKPPIQDEAGKLSTEPDTPADLLREYSPEKQTFPSVRFEEHPIQNELGLLSTKLEPPVDLFGESSPKEQTLSSTTLDKCPIQNEPGQLSTKPDPPTDLLKKSSPEEQNVSSTGLDKYPIRNEPGQLSTKSDPPTDLLKASSPGEQNVCPTRLDKQPIRNEPGQLSTKPGPPIDLLKRSSPKDQTFPSAGPDEHPVSNEPGKSVTRSNPPKALPRKPSALLKKASPEEQTFPSVGPDKHPVSNESGKSTTKSSSPTTILKKASPEEQTFPSAGPDEHPVSNEPGKPVTKSNSPKALPRKPSALLKKSSPEEQTLPPARPNKHPISNEPGKPVAESNPPTAILEESGPSDPQQYHPLEAESTRSSRVQAISPSASASCLSTPVAKTPIQATSHTHPPRSVGSDSPATAPLSTQESVTKDSEPQTPTEVQTPSSKRQMAEQAPATSTTPTIPVVAAKIITQPKASPAS